MNTWEAKTDYLHVVLPGNLQFAGLKVCQELLLKKWKKLSKKNKNIGSGAPNIIKRLGLGQPQIFFIKIGEW